jgi:hypothetical protein
LKRALQGWLSKWGVGLDEIPPDIDTVRVQQRSGAFIEMELAEDEQGFVRIYTSHGHAITMKTAGSSNELLIRASRESY